MKGGVYRMLTVQVSVVSIVTSCFPDKALAISANTRCTPPKLKTVSQ